MKISIVTPTYNRATYLEETIRSVLTQKGDFDLEYIIQDGGSNEELIEILEKWQSIVDSGNLDIQCNNVEFSFYIEPDDGMYDAVMKAFSRASGEVLAWLNSDDMYHPFAFQTVSQIFSRYQDVHWITGIPNSYNYMSSRTGYDNFPNAYSRHYLRKGYYDVSFLSYGFNWIQQESTFWRKSLWEESGGFDEGCRFAADYHLWRNFAKHTDLVRVQSFLGGYRVHEDQITADPQLYRAELPVLKSPPQSLKFLKSMLETIPHSRKQIFNARRGWPWLPLMGLEFNHLVGRVVEWSYHKNEWNILTKSIL